MTKWEVWPLNYGGPTEYCARRFGKDGHEEFAPDTFVNPDEKGLTEKEAKQLMDVLNACKDGEQSILMRLPDGKFVKASEIETIAPLPRIRATEDCHQKGVSPRVSVIGKTFCSIITCKSFKAARDIAELISEQVSYTIRRNALIARSRS